MLKGCIAGVFRLSQGNLEDDKVSIQHFCKVSITPRMIVENIVHKEAVLDVPFSNTVQQGQVYARSYPCDMGAASSRTTVAAR